MKVYMVWTAGITCLDADIFTNRKAALSCADFYAHEGESSLRMSRKTVEKFGDDILTTWETEWDTIYMRETKTDTFR